MGSNIYKKNKRDDLVHPELSYQIVGTAFEVFNQLGPGHMEKVYHKAMEEEFKLRGIKYKAEEYYNVVFKERTVGKSFLDFNVENKIIVELKKNGRFSKTNIEQVLKYLRVCDLRLAILINFGTSGVEFKRIVNIHQEPEKKEFANNVNSENGTCNPTPLVIRKVVSFYDQPNS